MSVYFRPLVQHAPPGAARPDDALPLAGGPLWFTHVERLERGTKPRLLPAAELPQDWRAALCDPRPDVLGLDLTYPRVMGILNVTPDSFSDGGQNYPSAKALRRAEEMLEAGADILDIGGESTRPGALEVLPEAELARVLPAVTALSRLNGVRLSIDTRKRVVAEAALEAGAGMINDVSGFTFDPGLAPLCARAGVPVCVMHSVGLPETMQDDPRYDDVLLEVFDTLAARIVAVEAQGIPRARIIADPGLGFGKTKAHNLALIRGLSLLHGLGVPLLLGASRKGFIREIGRAPDPATRAPGSIAVALAAVAQGVQILRVHDVAETVQALRLWQASTTGDIR